MRWLALVLIVGCTGATRTERDASLDAGTREAGRIALSCESRVEGTPFYPLELDELCAMFVTDAGTGCPRSPREFLQAVDCAREQMPEVTSRCGFDTYVENGAFGDSWTFDPQGVLVGARVRATLRCGAGIYATAPLDAGCTQPDQECGICSRKPDAACPADVLAAFPGGPCQEPTGIACPDCDEQPATLNAPCSPSCESCADGTCWTRCECKADGVYRTSYSLCSQ